MSRTMTSRLATAGMLTLATGLAGLVLAPSASAAMTLDPVTLSATTVKPGQNFTISGTDCISPADADYDAVAGVMSQDGDIYEEAEPGADGSWSITTAFPKDMAAGDQLMVAYCDWYTDGASYGEFTVKVGGEVGAIRGVEANTPGTKPVTTDKTTTSSAPGQKVVRVIAGFQPHEWVTLTMHSTPTVVGKFQADANGVVTVEFTLPAGTPAGTHTFVYEGDQGTYFQESFTVTAGGKKLAYTGADMTVPLTLGLGLVAAGAGALVVSRRKSAGATQV